jgi:hypothetical protein
MFMKNAFSKAVALSVIASAVQAASLDHLHSFVAAPRLTDIIIVRGPVIIGIINDLNGPVKKKKVAVYVDKRVVGFVSTNKYGVWSYTLNAAQQLEDGAHLVEACVTLASGNVAWTQAAMFNVNALRTRADHRSGNVSVTNSAINFPFGYVNTSTPIIVGSLLNSGFNPVVGETVQVQINGVTVGTVTSDSNGVFSYQVTTALSDGDYTVGAHCVQSNVDVTPNDFTISTVAPAAPVIITPENGDIVTTSDVTVSGTTEPNATVTTFLDGNAFGDINYADDSGNWSIDYTLDNGSHSVTAQATDLANNTGPVSAATNFTVSA